jgi:hypothetical protein
LVQARLEGIVSSYGCYAVDTGDRLHINFDINFHTNFHTSTCTLSHFTSLDGAGRQPGRLRRGATSRPTGGRPPCWRCPSQVPGTAASGLRLDR